MAVLRPARPAPTAPRAALLRALAELTAARWPARRARKVDRLIAACREARVELPAGVELWEPWRAVRAGAGACPCPAALGPLGRPCASGCVAEL